MVATMRERLGTSCSSRVKVLNIYPNYNKELFIFFRT